LSCLSTARQNAAAGTINSLLLPAARSSQLPGTQDEDLFRYLADMMKPNEKRSILKRLRRIMSGTLQILVSVLDPSNPPQSVLTSSLQQVAPFTGRGQLTLEVQVSAAPVDWL